MTDSSQPTDIFAATRAQLLQVERSLQSALIGQDLVIRELLVAIAGGGHVLLEGLPGLGKTQLVKAVTTVLGLEFGRIQCTPDLMPADITGSDLLGGDPGRQTLVFAPGPIFRQTVLVDEINRATPRTQAALLEAMQEGQVSHGGRQHGLPDPFIVIATQNPIELEGTYPLPEAQLDRFMFKIQVPYPDAAALRALIDVSLDTEPAGELRPVFAPGEFRAVRAVVRDLLIPEPCKQAAVALIAASQPQSPLSAEPARQHLRYGASPRALQALLRAARAEALRAGRVQVDISDIEAVARPVLRHRLLLTVESEIDGVTTDQVIDGLLADWQRRLP